MFGKLKYNIKNKTIRKKLFDFKNKEAQKKFLEATNITAKFKAIFDEKQPVEQNINNLLKTLDDVFYKHFVKN